MSYVDEIHAEVSAEEMFPEVFLLTRIEELLRERGWFLRRIFIAVPVRIPVLDPDGFVRGMRFSSVRCYIGGAVRRDGSHPEDFDDAPHRVVVNLIPRDTPASGSQRDHELIVRIYEG
jgi:hypothetical protein